MKKIRFIVLLLFLIILSKFIYSATGGTFAIGLNIINDWDDDGIPDNEDPDDDNDGINDTDDYLLGNSSSISTTIPDIVVKVNNSDNLSKIFNGSLGVNITNTSHSLVQFNWNFSLSTLNLYNVTIKKQNSTSNVGYILVNGLNLQGSNKKNITLDDVNPDIDSVCVKDSEINSINNISSDCTGIGEISVNCPGSNGAYSCKKIDSNTRYIISGLSNSAAIEQAAIVIEEEEEGGGGGGGGGGGRAAAAVVTAQASDFKLSNNLIKVLLAPGKSTRKSLTISNTGDTSLSINVDVEDLEEFMYLHGISEDSFELGPGESKTVDFIFQAESGKKPGVYTGKIIVKGDSIEKKVNTIIEIESEKPLFDVDVEILPRYQGVFPGEDVVAQIILYSMGGWGRVDVEVTYSIRDMEGNAIAEEHETMAVETQTSLVRSLKLPQDIKKGSYIFYVSAKYNGFVGSSSDVFEVIEKLLLGSKIFTPINMILGFIALILIGCTLFIGLALLDLKRSYMRHTTKPEEKVIKVEKPSVKIKERAPRVVFERVIEKPKEKKAKITREKLEKELRLLKESFESGYISEDSYNKSKRKIEVLLDRLD